jgi:hypothetical protein
MPYCTTDWYVSNRVGIGTDNPGFRLVICDNTSPLLQFKNPNDNSFGVIIEHTGTGSEYWNYENGFIRFGTSNAERMRITNTGNIGIGTSSPDSKLHVQDGQIRIHGAPSDSITGTQGYYIANICNNEAYNWQMSCNFNLGLWTFSNTAGGGWGLRGPVITQSGRFGIGTASPSTMLQVCGDVSGENAAWVQNTNSLGYGSLRALNNLNCAAVFGVGGSAVGAPYANTGYLYTDANVSFVFSIGTTEKMKITSTGNVGIACTSPGSKLTVGGTLTTTDTITTTSGTVSNYLTYTATTGVIGTQTNHALQIRTNDTERIRVTCTGCIGVNITSPTYTLHVNGTFYAAGSSCEYKTQICQYNTDSCMFMKLTPVTYQYKDEYTHLGKELKSGTQIGLIAEDVAEVYPELAILKDEDDQKIVRNVDYEKLSIVLLSEVQKLRKELDELKTK